MNNVIAFRNIKNEIREYRQKCVFKNKATVINSEDGSLQKYPCLVLCEEESDIPILYTGLERYLCHLSKSELLNDKTLSIKAYAVCHFLNYILKNTDLNSIHECSIDTFRSFLKFLKVQKNGTFYNKETWLRYRDYIIDFLVMYYTYNKDALPFNYAADELKSISIIRDEKKHKKATIVHNASLYISPPKTTHRKNRILVDGYLDLLLYEAKKYDPILALGIALGAYAGLREGEVVNLTCGSIQMSRRGFGIISGIEIDLTDKADHFMRWTGKSNPGSIKKNRKQKVYNDFVSDISNLYDEHIRIMESKNLDTSAEAPLFINKQGRPMTVQTYSERVKKLFYERFLPALKTTCEKQGTYMDNVAFIEAYEKEYPGAHMFRHWFTMYLLTKAKLTSGEIMRWRGDSNQESMNEYIHENQDLINIFKESSYSFQLQFLEDLNSI